jgi:peroxiredoxin Q/BCP
MDNKTPINIKIGGQIPSFSATDHEGNPVTEKDLSGKKHILFFYAQDDTPTCTKEACSLRDDYSYFKGKGYEIIGISKDAPKKHQKFIEKYSLPFPLIADTELSMLNAFGLFGPKKFMGKDVMGVYRTTVVTDEKGTVTHIVDKVESASHGQQLKNLLGI